MDGAKVFLACALGAFIGGVFAVWFELGLRIGILAGSLTGYISYDFGRVRRMAPIAAQRVAESCAALRGLPYRQYSEVALRVAKDGMVLLVSAIITMALFIFGVIGALGWIAAAGFSLTSAELSGYRVEVFILACFGVVGSVRYLALVERTTDSSREPVTRQHLRLAAWNPITAPVVVCFTLIRNIVRNFGKIWIICCELVAAPFKFAWHMFRLIHSDRRLLVATDAAIGTFVAWYLGNPVIGAIAGGALGWINFELVSVRWLKLVPKPAKSQ